MSVFYGSRTIWAFMRPIFAGNIPTSPPKPCSHILQFLPFPGFPVDRAPPDLQSAPKTITLPNRKQKGHRIRSAQIEALFHRTDPFTNRGLCALRVLGEKDVSGCSFSGHVERSRDISASPPGPSARLRPRSLDKLGMTALRPPSGPPIPLPRALNCGSSPKNAKTAVFHHF